MSHKIPKILYNRVVGKPRMRYILYHREQKLHLPLLTLQGYDEPLT